MQEPPSLAHRAPCAACVAYPWSWAYGILTMRTACIPVEEGDDDGQQARSNGALAAHDRALVCQQRAALPLDALPSRIGEATMAASAEVLVGHGSRTLAVSRVKPMGPCVNAYVSPQHSIGVSSVTGQIWPRPPGRGERPGRAAPRSPRLTYDQLVRSLL